MAVLHPFFRAEWFKHTISQDLRGPQKAAAEKLAVEKAETLFIYVAREYYNNSVSDDCELPETSPPKHGNSSAGNWLADVCDVEITAALPTERSEDNMMEEIRRYFKFEGGQGDINNPLPWYKVWLS
jgi:hypothetical protein